MGSSRIFARAYAKRVAREKRAKKWAVENSGKREFRALMKEEFEGITGLFENHGYSKHGRSVRHA